jgi:hypothetical protein
MITHTRMTEPFGFQTKPSFLFHCQIAQFDCGVCISEEADEATTVRNDPRRIGSGQNPDVDEPSLQHSTTKCTGKPKSDPNNNDERRLQGFFHWRSPWGLGGVGEVVGIKGGVVSGVINLESSGVSASDWRPRHEEHYQEV